MLNMDNQISLFAEPVPLHSPRFLSRLAGVLMARSGTTQENALILAEKAIDGTLCPCCGAGVKLYKRGLSRGQVETLLDLCSRFYVGQRFESKSIRARGGDYAKLVAFGLLYNFEDGGWCLTNHGDEFAKGLRSASRYAFFFLGELVGLSVESSRISFNAHKFSIDSISPYGVEMVFLR